ncbi:DUF4920 domain-containing protein [Flavobacterium sp. GT3R68]|uniref:DUF4920 domain-containing protein n=1 Tax=Flavobacterium sp. GT3R68 TaxID=2594437 RepID=UPI000F864C87|nr:DUF4920 domain-containing protein [Flavobacterium sp. GT3R68]RTY95176.1 DUF4920 domain-containing protein [Flavobacterium sp. GSN2]TRW91082.1 DUF4920 domain-containing protein [Flavobacterium sp. GT3R68]
MKSIAIVVCSLFVLSSCKKEVKIESKAEVTYATFGDSISAKNALSKEEMITKFDQMKPGDTLDVKFQAKIKEVCQKKGCWMTLDLAENKEAFVKFKDYAFFVPKNAKDEQVIISGKAYVSVESIDELRHYAKDAGKSQAAIDSIISPKTTYSVMANGVLIKG